MKNLQYFMDLDYAIEIKKIADNLGGGYMSSIPLLGRESVMGDGETIQESIASLEEAKEIFFEHCLENSINIPEPEEEINDFSGKLLVRLPKDLHRLVALKAKFNNSSLNQYICSLLSLGVSNDFYKNYITMHDTTMFMYGAHINEPFQKILYEGTNSFGTVWVTNLDDRALITGKSLSQKVESTRFDATLDYSTIRQ